MKLLDLNQFGKTIQGYRQKLNLNKSEMARKLNVSSQLYGQYESGLKSPKVDFYLKWKEAFGEDLMKLVETNGSPQSDSKPHSEAEEYKDKYYQILEERASLEKKVLLYARTNQALLLTVVEALVEIQAKRDKRKPGDVQAEMNNKVERHLQALRKDGI